MGIQGTRRTSISEKVGLSLPIFEVDCQIGVEPLVGYGPAAVTRAGTATYLNKVSGLVATHGANCPRMENKGLLLEGAATNLATRSEEFDHADWTKTRCSISADAVVAPDGQTTADKLVEDGTAAATHFITRSFVGLADNTIYTTSVFLKAAERTWCAAAFWDKAGGYTFRYFDLANVVAGAGNVTDYGIEAVGDSGWVRIWVSGDSSAGGGNVRIDFNLADGTPTTTYNGDGASGFYIWGAQVGAKAVPTSYIKTVAASANRATEAGYPTWKIGGAFSRQGLEGNFRKQAGTLWVMWTPGFAYDDLPDPLDIGCVTVRDDYASVIYIQRSGAHGYFMSFDGSNPSRYVTCDFAAGTTYFIALRWWNARICAPSDDASATGLQVGFSDDWGATWTWGTRGNFDGAFTEGMNIRLHYANEWPAHFGKIRLWRRCHPKINIEAF